jgi:peptidoglycan/xylan/chitin deacetylase (PgdA/CDA1 family)
MPWKERYTVTDERTLDGVVWPEGARCAVMVVVDPSPPCGLQGIGPRELDSDAAHYGLDVALPRMLDALDEHRIRATFPVPAVLAEHAPALVRSIAARGHEVAAHGLRREDVSQLERHEEAWRLARTAQVLADLLGQKPRGWYTLPRQTDAFAGGTISAHTVDLLIEAGYEYLGNSEADDIPHYWVTDAASRRAILAMPYCYHHDDQFFIEFPPIGQGGSNLERPETLFRNWRAEFDAMAGIGGQRAFGRCFTMVVHPWLNGWGQRLAVFERMLAHLRNGPAVWNPTAGECAAYWRSTYPAESTLKLAASIWADHPGSRS